MSNATPAKRQQTEVVCQWDGSRASATAWVRLRGLGSQITCEVIDDHGTTIATRRFRIRGSENRQRLLARVGEWARPMLD